VNDPFNAFPFAGGGRHGGPQIQPANLQDLFSMVLQSMQPIMAQGGPRGGNQFPGAGPQPFDFLSQILNPGNARMGDGVYTQEAFDRIMTQLMEQNAGSTAPPPASEDAIRSLQRKKVDKDMLGEEGKAECSICMEEVDIGADVTVLPCSHWFHGDCVTAWLKEHDTCPHCRKSISAEHDNQRRGSPLSRRRSRRASSVSSPRYSPQESRQSTSDVLDPPSPD
jgi:E3 ubiquitin-protein ligase RNF115/126